MDLDGLSGSGRTANITTWDWAPSTAVAKNGNGLQIGSLFELYTFGTLSSAVSGSTNIGTAEDLFGTGKEITFVAGFTEKVIDLSGTSGISETAVFAAQPGGFFRVYLDDINADTDLFDGVAGGGFNDGTLLFSGTITGGAGSFTSIFTNPDRLDKYDGGADSVVDDATATDAFNNGANSATPQMSVTGVGGTSIETIIKFDAFNPDYFLNVTSPLWYKFNTQTQNNLPFTTVDPANRYWDGDSLENVTIGLVNGGVGYGPDVIFQTDASTTDAGVVPEPTTMLLFGFGLMGLAAVSRRKNA